MTRTSGTGAAGGEPAPGLESAREQARVPAATEAGELPPGAGGEGPASASLAEDGAHQIGDFRIARGGPFYDLQLRLGLLRGQALQAGRRAALLVGLAWGVPLLLSALAGQALGPAASRPFLLDLVAWARFFVALGIFVLMERLVEERLRVHLDQFGRAPLLAPGARPAAAAAVVRALRRRDARVVELLCVVAAYAITLGGAQLVLGAETSSWFVTVSPAGASLTAAGWWCALVSSPLFWFLLLRWLWRHAVWGLLLRDLARLELRLVATHPMVPAGSLSSASTPTRSPPSCSRSAACLARRSRHAAAGRTHAGRLRPADGRLAGRGDDPVRRAAAGLHRAAQAAQRDDRPSCQRGRHPP